MNEKEINRYWKKIVNTMSEGLMLVGPDGIVVMVNEAFEHLTGYTAAEVVGKPCTIIGLRCLCFDFKRFGTGLVPIIHRGPGFKTTLPSYD